VAWDNSNTPTRTMSSRWSCAERRVGWFCFTCQPTVLGCEPHRDAVWRHFRREVTHCELFSEREKALIIAAAYDFFERYNRCPWRILSIIGSDLVRLYNDTLCQRR
jgi:hypothetical protein